MLHTYALLSDYVVRILIGNQLLYMGAPLGAIFAGLAACVFMASCSARGASLVAFGGLGGWDFGVGRFSLVAA